MRGPIPLCSAKITGGLEPLPAQTCVKRHSTRAVSSSSILVRILDAPTGTSVVWDREENAIRADGPRYVGNDEHYQAPV